MDKSKIKIVIGVPIKNKALKEITWMRICGNDLKNGGDITGVVNYKINDMCQSINTNFEPHDTCGACGWLAHKPIMTKKYNEKYQMYGARLVLFCSNEIPSNKDTESDDTIFIAGVEIADTNENVTSYTFKDNKWYQKISNDHSYSELLTQVSDDCKTVGIYRNNFVHTYLIKQVVND